MYNIFYNHFSGSSYRKVHSLRDGLMILRVPLLPKFNIFGVFVKILDVFNNRNQ